MQQQPTVSRCRFLRTKMAYLPDAENSQNWRSDQSTTSCYWCLCTMKPFGPDDHYTAPETCQPTRECYQDLDLV